MGSSPVVQDFPSPVFFPLGWPHVIFLFTQNLTALLVFSVLRYAECTQCLKGCGFPSSSKEASFPNWPSPSWLLLPSMLYLPAAWPLVPCRVSFFACLLILFAFCLIFWGVTTGIQSSPLLHSEPPACQRLAHSRYSISNSLWDFLGGSVAKTPCFQWRGPGFKSWSGN